MLLGSKIFKDFEYILASMFLKLANLGNGRNSTINGFQVHSGYYLLAA